MPQIKPGSTALNQDESALQLLCPILDSIREEVDRMRKLVDSANSHANTLQHLQLQVKELQIQNQANHNLLTSLDNIVRTGNGDSLVTRLKLIADCQERIVHEQKRICHLLESLEDRIVSLEHYRDKQNSNYGIFWWLLGGLGWLVTAAVAAYEAFKGK